MPTLPLGFKFKPSDEELVRYYLQNKLYNKQLPSNEVISECDIYGNKEPWEIWKDCYQPGLVDDKDKCIYVFSHVRKVANGGSRMVRQVGKSGGTWHGEDCRKKFEKEDGLVWFRRRFKYKNKNRKDEDNSWLMQEFSMEQKGNNNNLVLCKISRKEKLTKRDGVLSSPSVPSKTMSSGDFRASKRRKEQEEPSISVNTQQQVACSHIQYQGNYVDNGLFLEDIFPEGVDFSNVSGAGDFSYAQDLSVEDYGVTDAMILCDFPRL